MRAILFLLTFCAALASGACDQDRSIQGTEKGTPESGYMGVVLFPGKVVGSEPRFGLNSDPFLDLVSGAEPSPAQAASAISTFEYQFGEEDNIAEISWKYITSKSEGDIYEFTLKRPLGEPSETVQTKTVAYAGQSVTLFEYGAHHFVIEPTADAPE